MASARAKGRPRDFLQKLSNNPKRLTVLVARSMGASWREAGEAAGITESSARKYEDAEWHWAIAQIQDKLMEGANAVLVQGARAGVKKAWRIALGYDRASAPQVSMLKDLLERIGVGTRRHEEATKHLHVHGHGTLDEITQAFNPFRDAVENGDIRSLEALRKVELPVKHEPRVDSDDEGGGGDGAGEEAVRSVLRDDARDRGRAAHEARQASPGLDGQTSGGGGAEGSGGPGAD